MTKGKLFIFNQSGKRIQVNIFGRPLLCLSLIIQIRNQLMNQYMQSKQFRADHLFAEIPINESRESQLLRKRHQVLNYRLNIFDDDQMINLETSIPILRTAGILNIIESFDSAKNQLENDHSEDSLLKQEARYLYYLWQMINEEQIDCRELKQIIKFTLLKSRQELRIILTEIYNQPTVIDDYVQSCEFVWLALSEVNNNQPNFQSFGHSSQGRDKQNSYYLKYSKSSNIASPIEQKSSGKKYYQHQSMMTNQFHYPLQISTMKEKELVDRLYQNDQYKKRQQLKKQVEQQRQQQEMKQCTFKPNVKRREKSTAKSSRSNIKGFDKAVSRIKAGTQKNKLSQKLRDYKPIGENYEKLRNKSINPPKFLNRKKEEQNVLFIISFDLGKHKTNVKIRESDTEQSVAERLCKIYSLKQEFYDEICEIVRGQLQAYYLQLYQNQSRA